jgi:hypothetical protein
LEGDGVRPEGGGHYDDNDLEKGSKRELFPEGGAGDGDSDDIDKGEKQKPGPISDATPFALIKMVALLLVTVIVIVIVIVFCSIGTAYYGTKLAIENGDYGVRQGDIIAPAAAPTFAPTGMPLLASNECDNGYNDLLEFRLTFDSSPGQVGFSLYDVVSSGTNGSGLWIFNPGTFQSFNQFQQENIFRLCVSSNPSYRFEVSDTASNGLAAKFGATTVFGSWELKFNQEIIASYEGDCEVDTSEKKSQASNSTMFACGAYCRCSFALGGNTTGGDCITNCDEEDGDA